MGMERVIREEMILNDCVAVCITEPCTITPATTPITSNHSSLPSHVHPNNLIISCATFYYPSSTTIIFCNYVTFKLHFTPPLCQSSFIDQARYIHVHAHTVHDPYWIPNQQYSPVLFFFLSRHLPPASPASALRQASNTPDLGS